MSATVLTRLEDLGEVIEQNGWKRFLLVVDPIAYEQARERLAPFLAGHQVCDFSHFEPNPRIQHVSDGMRSFKGKSDQAVIAVGGGTAIDIAKLLCFFAAQDSDPTNLPSLQWLEAVSKPGGRGSRRAENSTKRGSAGASPSRIVALKCALGNPAVAASRRHPLIAVPTTAGTGSEATQFAVVYVEETKHSVSHPSLLPDVAVIDATLTQSLPPHITASTGLDAVSQAIESMWSVRSTEESIALAEQALRLGLSHLENAVLSPTLPDRTAMMEAAHLAGRAINISHTTAAHALSYSMTIRHQVPHGMAVAISIAPFMRFNAQVQPDSLADPRGMSHVRHVFDRIASAFHVNSDRPDTMHAVANRWEQLLQRIGCRRRLRDWQITDAAERVHIARSVNPQRLANNPRVVTDRDLTEILDQIA